MMDTHINTEAMAKWKVDDGSSTTTELPEGYQPPDGTQIIEIGSENTTNSMVPYIDAGQRSETRTDQLPPEQNTNRREKAREAGRNAFRAGVDTIKNKFLQIKEKLKALPGKALALAEKVTEEAFAAYDWADETIDAIDAKITKIEAEIRAKIEKIKQEAREKRQNFWAKLRKATQEAWKKTKEFFSQAKESFLSKLRGNQTEKIMQLVISIVESAQKKGEQVDIPALTRMLDALAEAKFASKKSVDAARDFINVIASMPSGRAAAAA